MQQVHRTLRAALNEATRRGRIGRNPVMAPTNTRPATERLGAYVDPDDLVCPGCGEPGRCEPPGYWRVVWGLPAAGFSHQDASALCLARSTGRPAEPVEIGR